MMLDFSRCRLPPFKHQREDTQALIDHPFFFIASEMRTGKTKIVIDAAQFLFERGTIDKVIIVTPAPVRDVWNDEPYGELAKHLWKNLPATVTEFHARIRTWVHGEGDRSRTLDFFVTNYEFLRGKTHLTDLFSVCGPKTLLVGDESSFLKNHAAQQTKAFAQLRKRCGRVVLLNGTPLFHSPLDLFSQGNLLHPSILDCQFVTHFKARYALQQPVLGYKGKPLDNGYGKPVMKISGWTNLDDLQRRFAPYTVRRLQRECLDLPPKLDPITLTATLTPATWKAYKAMRDELVVWLTQNTIATSSSAAVKALRLSQITGGFLGGVEAARIEPVDAELLEHIDLPGSFLNALTLQPTGAAAIQQQAEHFNKVIETLPSAQEIGHEKLDVLLWFIGEKLEADPNLHLVVWCRFRAEAFRTLDAIAKTFPQFETAAILGGQKKDERLRALALLKPETSPVGPVCVVGIEGTGSFGLDMCAAHTCVTISSGYSPGRAAQTLDRVYGPNQKFPIAYYDIVAVGPRGQRTIDHDVLVARRTGEDVALRTASAWVRALTEE